MPRRGTAGGPGHWRGRRSDDDANGGVASGPRRASGHDEAVEEELGTLGRPGASERGPGRRGRVSRARGGDDTGPGAAGRPCPGRGAARGPGGRVRGGGEAAGCAEAGPLDESQSARAESAGGPGSLRANRATSPAAAADKAGQTARAHRCGLARWHYMDAPDRRAVRPENSESLRGIDKGRVRLGEERDEKRHARKKSRIERFIR